MSKKRRFTISKEDLEKQIASYLKKGGKITKVETDDTYYNNNPVKSDNYSRAKGVITGNLDFYL